jgi:hypothetical protein
MGESDGLLDRHSRDALGRLEPLPEGGSMSTEPQGMSEERLSYLENAANAYLNEEEIREVLIECRRSKQRERDLQADVKKWEQLYETNLLPQLKANKEQIADLQTAVQCAEDNYQNLLLDTYNHVRID